MKNLSIFFKKIVKNIFSPSRSVITKREYIDMKKIIKSPKRILNVGSGSNTVLGSKFWKYLKKNQRVINLDIVDGENVDVVSDAGNMPFLDNSFDFIVCQAVIEHLKNPKIVINEIKRVLKEGGYFYCTVPFLQGYHADPNDYQRFTNEGMKILLKHFTILKKGVSSGPFSAIAWIIRDIFTFGKKSSFIYRLSRIVSSILSFPVSLLDYIYPRTLSYARNASEYYYLAKSKK